MDKVTISNLQGESGLVNVIRYFNNNGKECLIYSLNEVDESGYTRLYVTNLSGIDGMYTAETLNDNEWNEVKNLVKLIIKANKEGMPVPVQDLNPKKINNILLKDKKVFKLNASLVNDLENNKPSFEEEKQVVENEKALNPFETQVQPTFENQNISSFDSPVQPTFDNGNMPTFGMPNTTPFETPVQPTFENQSISSFDSPVQSTFGMPNTTPFETPVQPTFETQVQPTFETQVQPTFGMPETPTFQTQEQPAFGMPNTTSFETQVQPTFDSGSMPTFEIPNIASFDTQQQVMTNSNSDENYKEKYEQLLKQYNDMQSEIAKYQTIIDNIKNMIEK